MNDYQSQTHTCHPSTRQQSANPLHLAIKSILFGAVLLPVAPLANAELVIDQRISDPSVSVDAGHGTQAITDTKNAFDGVDFDAIERQSQQTVATESRDAANDEKVISHTDFDQPVINTNSDSTDNVAAEATVTAEKTENEQARKIQNDEPSMADAFIKRLGFEGNGAKSQSLAKLAEHYHTKPNDQARCQGTWVQPERHSAPTQTRYDENSNPLPADTIYAQSDYGYYDAEQYAELSGNVIVEQNGQQVIADKIMLNTLTGEAIATGQVQFSDGGMPTTEGGLTDKIGVGIIGVADSLEYSTDGKNAAAKDVAFASTSINAHGYAGQMQKLSQNEYQMSDVMFSTCPPTERKWYLDSQKIDINSDTGRAIARNTTLRIKDVPVLYLPYFNFPIDDRRASGFLLPTVGFGSSDSFEISTPYYLNLAPNYDATITPTIYTNRNPMVTGEFRYLTKNFGSGVLTGSYLPNDQKYHDEDRSRIRYDHNWRSQTLPQLSAYAQYQYLSDARYLSDFDSLGLETAKLNLPRRIGVNYFNENIDADLRIETFQKLDATDIGGTRILDKDRPYARLPQLSVNYRLPKSWINFSESLEISGIHNSAYFKKSIEDSSDAEKSGARMYNQISASYPMLRTWGYVTPKLSLTHLYTSYDQDSLTAQNLSEKDGTYSIFAPTVSIDSGLFFQKTGSPFGLYDDSLGGYQTLTPRLHYTYTPYKNQQNLPNFDTGFSQISYDQLLSDSWFLGYDRIQDLHAITPAVNYRYIDRTGKVRFDGSIAEQILLDDMRVGIDNSERYSGHSSGMAWQASVQPRDNLWLETAGALTNNYDLNTLIAQVRYQPNEGQLFNFGVVERKENKATNQQALSAYTASAVFPINNRWRMLGQVQYDYKNDLLMDSLVGVNYEDCCYGLSIYARRYRDSINPQIEPNNAIMAEVRLNGITNGSKLNQLMRDKVLGFDDVQHAWQKAY
ncbi:LPS assembly protein LptD [uncultured Moraxella sp.]|uniref:LPS-assembly protein LptD n=1 Tax=uncultured Moraxella sp. TaxID=263769 RepID=UPI0025DCFAC1|nr:LPS assembly protein LptD [uncultured Moraxella sp.]